LVRAAQERKYGSQAALLVVLLDPVGNDGGIGVQALAVGDCNVMVLRARGTIAAFPVESSSSFNSTPELVASRPQANLSYGRWATRIEAGDVILASTDAVGQWMLACVEANREDALVQVLIDLATTSPLDPVEPGVVVAGEDGILRETLSTSTFKHPLRQDDLTLVMCQSLSVAGSGSSTGNRSGPHRQPWLKSMTSAVSWLARRIR
jgi:hypothetical protein